MSTTQTEALKLALEGLVNTEALLFSMGLSRLNVYSDIEKAITAIKEALSQPEPKCNPHPKAPHGFDRNASHANDRYTCECEGWNAYDAGYEDGVIAGIEASMEQEPEQKPVAIDWSAVHEKLIEVWNREISADEGFDEIQDLIDTTPPQHSASARSSSATPRKPLTIDQIASIAIDRSKLDGIVAFVRAIEAAHGIKGDA